MKILKFYTDGRFAVEDIENSCKGFQQAVGGYFETVRISADYDLIVNEEGKINDLPFNENATKLFRTCRNTDDCIFGDAFVSCLNQSQEDFTDMPEKGITAILAAIGLHL